ncbi:MAG: hypothetical protein JW875_07720 [Spirochaetales bacterium]|nr:hypothetical protein [Spirochaetales bacterium]
MKLFTGSRKHIVLLWLCWSIALGLFQSMVMYRFPVRPVDRVLPWTALETGRQEENVNARLAVPIFTERVAWDSEFYLSIAQFGYDDPAVRKVYQSGRGSASLNYAFMPGYPYTVRAVAAPFIAFGAPRDAATVIAALAVSLAGALLAALSLFAILCPDEGRAHARRASWYMLIFPSAFFLAQVYTEALFLGLVLAAIAQARKGRWTVTALIASCAVLTRAAGVALVPAIAVTAIRFLAQEHSRARVEEGSTYHPSFNQIAGILQAVLVPFAVFLVWKFSFLGERFDIVEHAFFGRSFAPIVSIRAWLSCFASIISWPSPRGAYYAIELAALGLALVSSVWGAKRYPDLVVFGLAVLAASVLSVATQGIVRYVLSCPIIFVFLAHKGRCSGFDRVWSLISILLLGFFALLFSLDMWVA